MWKVAAYFITVVLIILILAFALTTEQKISTPQVITAGAIGCFASKYTTMNQDLICTEIGIVYSDGKVRRYEFKSMQVTR